MSASFDRTMVFSRSSVAAARRTSRSSVLHFALGAPPISLAPLWDATLPVVGPSTDSSVRNGTGYRAVDWRRPRSRTTDQRHERIFAHAPARVPLGWCRYGDGPT